MPVWHAATKELRERGDLIMIGITQEQHPDRCRLFAQWQGLDWPILWDPFNLTGSKVVPSVTAIDEHGVVRFTRLNARRVELQFLDADFEVPAATPETEPAVLRSLVEASSPGNPRESAALARLLWEPVSTWDGAIETLEAAAREPDVEPSTIFRLGVAYRLRYDSERSRPSDFADSIAHWSRALARNPNQYIWRRRLQQYGPRLDKPYPFYDWIERATREVAARGEQPVAVRVALTGAEQAMPARRGSSGFDPPSGEPTAPDPEGAIERDSVGLVGIETAVARHTRSGTEPGPARVHLAFRPAASKAVHWSNDAGPTTIWIEACPGWQLEGQLFSMGPLSMGPLSMGEEDTELSSELRTLDFEIAPVAGEDGSQSRDPAGVLSGYALYYVCEGREGTCRFLRQDFELALRTN